MHHSPLARMHHSPLARDPTPHRTPPQHRSPHNTTPHHSTPHSTAPLNSSTCHTLPPRTPPPAVSPSSQWRQDHSGDGRRDERAREPHLLDARRPLH
eukprot:6172055-Pleurochrysis_carterae.AAC.1